MLLCVGPEGTGKTLLLKRIIHSDNLPDSRTLPTVGVNIHSYQVDNHTQLTIRELGGCMAPIWKSYYKGVQRVIYVVDAANLMQIGAASLLFLELLNSPFLQNAEFSMSSFMKPATLVRSPQRDCFVSIPREWMRLLKQCSLPTFSIECEGSSPLILSWNGQYSEHSENDIISVNEHLLSANKFHHTDVVIVRQIDTPLPLSSVSVKISSAREWEDLILNAEFVQEQLLNQIRIVAPRQKMPLWLEGGNKIVLEICEENRFGLLFIDSQLQIVPPDNSQSKDMTVNPTRQIASTNCDSEIHSMAKTLEKLTVQDSSGLIRQSLYSFKHLNADKAEKSMLHRTLRAVPLTGIKDKNILGVLRKHPSLVIISEKLVEKTSLQDKMYFLANVKKKHFDEETSEANIFNDDKTGMMTEFTCIILIWEKFMKLHPQCGSIEKTLVSLHIKKSSCLVSEPVTKYLGLEYPDLVTIDTHNVSAQRKKAQVDLCFVGHANMNARNCISGQVIEILKEICNIVPVILNKHNFIQSNEDSHTDVCIVPAIEDTPLLIDEASAPLLDIRIQSEGPTILPFKRDHVPEKVRCHDNDLIRDLMNSIQSDLMIDKPTSEFRLLYGSKGSGKSTAVQCIKSLASSHPYFINVRLQDMKCLSNKKASTVKKLLMEVLVESLFYQPSLIILEDIDCLVPNDPTSSENQSPSSEYAVHVADVLKVLLNQLQQDNRSMIPSLESNARVTVLATCLSPQHIHPKLSDPQGNHIFSKTYSMATLSDQTRWSVLCQQLQDQHKAFLRSSEKSLDLKITEKKWATNLQRFNLADLKNLSLRIYIEAKQRWNKIPRRGSNSTSEVIWELENEDMERALKNFVPASLKDLKDRSRGHKNVKLGGLKSAFKLVTQTILWPIQYPNLFAQSSMRTRCGILLYGPPGCGKTLLANTIAKSPLVNFISIKGPELLSKYIGQSEQAVRNAFEQASSMKPCVLFFDEFDALAPRRGHDNTGVTDRVVNQFLTEMDGVNGLTGVSVLAATSRPDLIDPALLRPGRLDKCILCPMPDENDRLQILEALSENLEWRQEIDWTDIARKTENFSGADLQSLLAVAQVKAAQELLGDSLYENAMDSKGNLYGRVKPTDGISLKHVEAALDSAKPSISASERLKYERQHQAFVSARKGNTFGNVKPGLKGTFA